MSKKEELSGFQLLLSKIKRLVNEEENDYDVHYSDVTELKPVSKKVKEQKEMVRKASENFELPLESVSVMEVLEAFQEKNSLNMAELIKNVSLSLSTSALASLSEFIAVSYSESYSQSISEKGYSLRNSMSNSYSISDSFSVSESLSVSSVEESMSHSLYVSDSESLLSSQSASVAELESISVSQSLSVRDFLSESEETGILESESFSESSSDFVSESESYSESESQQDSDSVSLITSVLVSDSEETGILESESFSESSSEFVSESENYSESESQQDSDSVSLITSDLVSESEETGILESESLSESSSEFVSKNDLDEVDSKHLMNLVEIGDNVDEFMYETSVQVTQPWGDSENGNSWIGQEKEGNMQEPAFQQLSREFKNVVSRLSGLSSIIHNKGRKNHLINNDIFK